MSFGDYALLHVDDEEGRVGAVRERAHAGLPGRALHPNEGEYHRNPRRSGALAEHPAVAF